ncbi:phosphoribosyltransferase [Candidatus Microgenomates bacterium]|nr:phosphoribosyltransferase [Candidatus Microgenomates bacterium]
MFQDRTDAGKKLAATLKSYENSKAIVLALPRGGVVVGYEVSKELNLPLDVLVVRKIGAPFNSEYAIGALSEKDTLVMGVHSGVEYSRDEVKEIIDQEKTEMKRRIRVYRAGRSLPKVGNKTVILVDDGLATGLTAQAAIASIRKLKAKQVVFAAPVCARDCLSTILPKIDNINCLLTPDYFTSIGSYYKDFSQVSDKEVIELLAKSKNRTKQ